METDILHELAQAHPELLTRECETCANNLGARMAVMAGRLPVSEVDGPQHERFEDTFGQVEEREEAERT